MLRYASLFGASAVVLMACSPEVEITAVDAEIEVSPSLTELGEVPVGADTPFAIKLGHARGLDVTIFDVAVTNVEGSFISYAGEIEFTLERSTTMDLNFSYLPTEVGYHRAQIEIFHNGEDSPAVVDVRGRAILPEATVWPLGVDFGPVEVGGTSQRTVTVANQSDSLDLTLDDSSISNPVFTLVTELPLVVGAGNESVVTLEFLPTSENPAVGTLTLKAGTEELPVVSLRGNDCENGDPDAYDVDNDGYTLCGGDCDDNNADINPGAAEVANGVDDNCNNGVDEDTEWADDDGDGFCEDDFYCSDGSMPGDCADNSDLSLGTANVNPNAYEILDNGIDDDCDGIVDQGTTDFDGDGYSPDGGDCDDNDADVFPGGPELPDWKDNDCDSTVDEGTVLYDDDGDGYCEDAKQCSDYSMTGDCDDSGDLDNDGLDDGRPTHPNAVEQPDWQDNDCDGIVDEGTVNYDDDGDGYTETGGDCDDTAEDLDMDGIPDGALISPALGNSPC